jgi:predicted dienelactone hydrolase
MAVGYRALVARDEIHGADVAIRLLYPSDAPPTRLSFGPYVLEAAVDVAPREGARPLVVISHGSGGTPWAYRGLAGALVDAGFVVALIEHPGDSRADGSLSGTAANLANRPRHLRRALDVALALPFVAPGRAAVIGHSMGGYTALAVAGGRPVVLPHEAPDGVGRPILVEADPRVRAVVLLAPAVPWFVGPEALRHVRVPLLVRTGACDELMPPALVAAALTGLPADAAVDHAVVPGAGHFAWFFPVPPALIGLPPGRDPPGFDRAAYQPTLHAELIAFLRATA